jgi:protein SCO1/2
MEALEARMNRRSARSRVPILCIPILVAIVFATGLIASSPGGRAATAPVTIGGPFTLTASDGTTVTDGAYRGKWLLVFFGYTFCPDTCPTTLNHVALALQDLGADAAKVQPIFITVDPARDTPEIMGQYAEAFDPRIVGLTGSPQQIAAVMEDYGAYSAQHQISTGGDYLVDHSTYIYVMDPFGKFVRGLDSDSRGSDIADTLRNIIAESAD